MICFETKKSFPSERTIIKSILEVGFSASVYNIIGWRQVYHCDVNEL